MRKILSLICFSFLFTASLAAADIDGAWLLEYETPRGVQQWTLTLASDGTTLTGDIQGVGRERKTVIAEGQVTGKEFSFTSVLSRPKREIKLFWSGTIDGSTMNGNLKTEESEPRDFTATKQ
jgi:hypothetical protein